MFSAEYVRTHALYSYPNSTTGTGRHIPWNKVRLISPKPLLKLSEFWALRIRLQPATHARDLAPFNLDIDGGHYRTLPAYPWSVTDCP